MKSSALDVPSYIAQAPADRQAALRKLRALCRNHLQGTIECIDYGMPVYKSKAGEMVVAFASQKNYIAFYGCGQLLLANHADEAKKLDMGKGCIRFKKPEQIDFALIGQLLDEKQATLA